MSRCRWGAALLAGLLLLGLLGSGFVEKRTEPAAETLRQAAEAALSGDLPKAEALVRRARADWEQREWLWSILFHQDRVEEVTGHLEQLEIWLAAEETVSFAVSCLELAQEIQALGQEHSLALPHLL